ncbi:MAG: ribonuclease III [Peptococcaceae bacterium]|nr:ribonuclease III [Peptococcaceae bacterium]
MEKIDEIKINGKQDIFPGKLCQPPHLISPLILAYIGDAVYELLVRSHLVRQGYARTDEIHSRAVKHVRADAQAKALLKITDILSKEESEIVRRGRNAKSFSAPKDVSIATYRYSTGLECLVGYLYLKSDFDRLTLIMNRIFKYIEEGE